MRRLVGRLDGEIIKAKPRSTKLAWDALYRYLGYLCIRKYDAKYAYAHRINRRWSIDCGTAAAFGAISQNISRMFTIASSCYDRILLPRDTEMSMY